MKAAGRVLIVAVGIVVGVGVTVALWRSLDSGGSGRGPTEGPAGEANLAAIRPEGQGARPAEGAEAARPGEPPPRADLGAYEDPRHARVASRVDEYQAYVDRLMDEPLAALVDRWPEVVARNDPDELPAFLATFAARLRLEGTEEVYSALAAILYDPSATRGARKAVLTLFGQTATPLAVAALTEFLLSDSDTADVAEVLRESLHEAAYGLPEGHPNWDVAPVLGDAWRQLHAEAPAADQMAVADGIAYLSTAEGAQALLDTLREPPTGEGVRQTVASAALARLQANEAVPVLGSVLADPERDPLIVRAAVTGLVAIDSADAYWVLMADLRRPGVWEGAQLEMLREALAHRQLSDEAVRVIEHELEREAFEDERVTELLREVLAEQDAAKEAEGDE